MSAANMAKSVHQRLLNLRDETGEPFDRLLIRYGLERLLYRLQMAGYGDDKDEYFRPATDNFYQVNVCTPEC